MPTSAEYLPRTSRSIPVLSGRATRLPARHDAPICRRVDLPSGRTSQGFPTPTSQSSKRACWVYAMYRNGPSAMPRRIKYFEQAKPTSTIPVLIQIETRRADRTFPFHPIRPSGGTIARLVRCTRSMEAVTRFTNRKESRDVAFDQLRMFLRLLRLNVPKLTLRTISQTT